MSQFVRTQPSAVKVFVYYEKQREECGEKMNKRMWDLIDGGNEITIVLDKMKAVNGESTKEQIKQLVLADPTSLRLCILSEVVEKKSIIESFLNITKMIGTQDIDCHDFEFWYERFDSGNWDLNQKTICDMPIDILAAIAEKLDFPTQIQLRSVSRGFRNIVDDVRLSIDYIICRFEKSGDSKLSSSIEVHKVYRNFSKNYEEDDLGRAMKDLKILLNNRHLRLRFFEWHNYASSEIDKQLIDMLSTLNHKLKFERLETSTNDSMYGLLKAIVPTTLEDIWCKSKLVLSDIDRLAQLEQWKKAEFVYFQTDVSEFSRSCHYFLHFKIVSVHAESLSIDDILSIKQLFLQNNMLERFDFDSITIPSMEDVEDALGPSDISVDEDDESFPGFEQGWYRIYSIPGSNDILELRFYEDETVFERKNT